MCLALFAFVAGPVLAQNAESTEEFQRRRREIEARWLAANNSGDDAGKSAAAAELRALGLTPPAVATPDPATENETWFEHLIRRLREIFGIEVPPANGGDTGLGNGGNTQPPAPTFRVIVEKNDGSALTGVEYLVGEKVELRARIEPLTAGGTVPTIESHNWTVPGSSIKSYSLDIITGFTDIWNGRPGQTGNARHANMLTLTQAALAEADRQAANISFYWTSEGQNRRVTCRVRAGGAEATGEGTINVRRSTNPARDLYNNTSKFSGNWDTRLNHSSWHPAFTGTDRFIYFHREYLRGYNVWRQLFGYPAHVATADPAAPGSGEFGGQNAKPTYLTTAGGTERSSQHNAQRLADFANADQLGDDLEDPWHNTGHGMEGDKDPANTDMYNPSIATRCEVFYIWHTRVDNVARDWEAARP